MVLVHFKTGKNTPKLAEMLSQNLVQGWVKTWSKYVAQHNWTKFWLKKCVFLIIFLLVFFKISFSLQKEEDFWKKTKQEKTEKTWTKFWLKKRPFLDQVLTLQHIYAVELKTGPIFAFSSVKNWSNFFCFSFFVFLKISFSLQKEEDFSKKNQKKPKKMTHF